MRPKMSDSQETDCIRARDGETRRVRRMKRLKTSRLTKEDGFQMKDAVQFRCREVTPSKWFKGQIHVLSEGAIIIEQRSVIVLVRKANVLA